MLKRKFWERIPPLAKSHGLDPHRVHDAHLYASFLMAGRPRSEGEAITLAVGKKFDIDPLLIQQVSCYIAQGLENN